VTCGQQTVALTAVCIHLAAIYPANVMAQDERPGTARVKAAFQASALTVPVSSPVTFKDQSAGNPAFWLWDFDDGDSDTNKITNHRFQKPGSYNVSLKVTGSEASNVATTNITIHVVELVRADFKAAPSKGPAPLDVTFLDDSDGEVLTRNWDFGEEVQMGPGAPLLTRATARSGEENPHHTYVKPGTYTVSLTVTGVSVDGGITNKSTTRAQIKVTQPSNADFTATPASGEPPLKVQFHDKSSGNVTSWSWDFGDKSKVATQRNPTHKFTKEGSYDVTLRVSGPGGSDAITQSDRIVVKTPRLPVPKVRGLNRKDAEEKIRRAGFIPIAVVGKKAAVTWSGIGGQVYDQDPPENTKIRKGSAVTLTVYKDRPTKID